MSGGPILVVDDDQSFRACLREVLEPAGFEVHEAPDGEHALVTARETRPVLVLLDVRLPGISGYEVLRRLHETLGPDVPVIFLSAERKKSGRRPRTSSPAYCSAPTTTC